LLVAGELLYIEAAEAIRLVQEGAVKLEPGVLWRPGELASGSVMPTSRIARRREWMPFCTSVCSSVTSRPKSRGSTALQTMSTRQSPKSSPLYFFISFNIRRYSFL
jgi:hypothetical protein